MKGILTLLVRFTEQCDVFIFCNASVIWILWVLFKIKGCLSLWLFIMMRGLIISQPWNQKYLNEKSTPVAILLSTTTTRVTAPNYMSLCLLPPCGERMNNMCADGEAGGCFHSLKFLPEIPHRYVEFSSCTVCQVISQRLRGAKCSHVHVRTSTTTTNQSSMAAYS